jgi:murein L,D-transpeptidase YcbB/YkuD
MPLALCLLLLAWPVSDARAQAAPPESEAIRALIMRGSVPELRHPDFREFRLALDSAYSPGSYAPLWVAAGATPAGMLAELKDAPSHGLDVRDYDVAWLEGEVNAIAAGDRATARIARADVVLTVSFFRLLSDVRDGRVSPERAGFKLEEPNNPIDLAAVVLRAKQTGQWHEAVVAAAPPFVLYRRLEAALARYRALALQPTPALAPLPAGKSKIAPGDVYAGVAALSERLRLVGDLPANFVAPTDNKYDGALVDAVGRFQDRHGLKADGVIGRDTLAQLSVPFSERVRQIELSLERLRWLPKLPPRPLIAVNIPSFRLWAFTNAGDDTAAQLTMPVIVGRAVSARKTPIFIGEMRYIEFSPYWNVPPAILRSETIPKLEREPGYWQSEDLEAVPVSGPATPITEFNAQTLDGLKSGKLRVRQRPGPKNALGAVKFVLPNTMDIYLHSTPAQQLFSETRRDFSHGCIRLSDPPALAAFVLRDQPEWTKERIEEAMNSGKANTAKLTEPLPVLIFYTTAIVDSTGAVRFTSDIYGYDRKLEDLLAQAT